MNWAVAGHTSIDGGWDEEYLILVETADESQVAWSNVWLSRVQLLCYKKILRKKGLAKKHHPLSPSPYLKCGDCFVTQVDSVIKIGGQNFQ